jgi:hypothetical protein
MKNIFINFYESFSNFVQKRKLAKAENKKLKKKLALEIKEKKFREEYFLKFSINEERDLLFLREVISQIGSKYLKELEIVFAHPSKENVDSIVSDKAVKEDRIRLINNAFSSTSREYRNILHFYMADDQGIIDYIALCMSDIDKGIIGINARKINKARGAVKV